MVKMDFLIDMLGTMVNVWYVIKLLFKRHYIVGMPPGPIQGFASG
jgi:hypothetical protein